jgi:PDZ domain-containing protein
MRLCRQLAPLAMIFAAFLASQQYALAQTGIGAAGSNGESGGPSAPGASSQTSASTPADASTSDQTLEIAPRIPSAPPAPPPEPDSGGNSNDITQPADSAPAPAPPQSLASLNADRPYLGIAVQTIFSNERPGAPITGLEVVSVDDNSPAAIAGLRGRTNMSSAGESGATVGALVPPLDLFVMPLLKKSGSLGQTGDLIIAIDDRRVTNNLDLESELGTLKPGDVIYLTITRSDKTGAQQTLKLPIKLGDASQAISNAGNPGNIPSSTTSAASPKSP